MTVSPAMVLGRRTLLAGATALAGAAAVPSAAAAMAPPAGLVTLYDPALPRAAALAQATGGAPRALQGDRVRCWQALGGDIGAIAGFTSWSDYVLLRGLAAEAGLRVRAEADLSASVPGTLIAWTVG